MNAQLYDKNIQCPVCNKEFVTKKVRMSAIRVLKRDEDFCPYFNSENPLFYGVFVCPFCGYGALENTFLKIKEDDKEKIRKHISSKWSQRDYGGKRTLDEAIKSYKLALLCCQIIEAPKIIIGKICLRLSWFYRYLSNKKEKDFIKFTIESFSKAYTEERIRDNEYDEVVILYLLGELNRRIGNYKEAIKWFSKSLENPDIKKKRHIELKAREQWSLTREEYKRKYAQAN